MASSLEIGEAPLHGSGFGSPTPVDTRPLTCLDGLEIPKAEGLI